MTHLHHHHGHHHHGHSHSRDVEHIESAARAHWDGIAPSPRRLGGLDELSVRLCMAQGAHHPHAAPRCGLFFTEGNSQNDSEIGFPHLSELMNAPFEMVSIQSLGSVEENKRMLLARDLMKVGSKAAADAMKRGAKVLLIAVHPYPLELQVALLGLWGDMSTSYVSSQFFVEEINRNKSETLRQSLEDQYDNPVAVFAQIGSAELLAAMGAVLQAGSHGTAIVFDGLHVALAGAAAARIDASVKHSMFCAVNDAQCEAAMKLNMAPVSIGLDATEPTAASLLALQRLDLAANLMNRIDE